MKDIKRNINLDAIRSFAIIGVVTLHLVGGVRQTSLNTWNELIVSIILAINYCAVNLFGLLSGYLRIDKSHHNSSLVRIIFQTFFWCLLIFVISILCFEERNVTQLIKYLFPFLGDRLWYITCYVFVFLCTPYLNILADKLSRNCFHKLMILLFVLMSVVTAVFFKDFFHVVSNGYSAAWLAYMYLLGAYFKKYGFGKLKKIHFWIILIVCICSLVVSKYILEVLLSKIGANIDGAWHFYYYSSPLTLIISICFFYLFVNATFKNSLFAKILTWLSSVSLGVYIIHAHPFSLDHLLIGKNLTWIVYDNPIVTLLISLACIMGIVLATGLMEQLRIILFRVIGIDKISNKIGIWIDRKLSMDQVSTSE